MRVRELMTRKVATVRTAEVLSNAVRLMRERGCGCIAVLGEDDRLVGVLTDRDVCMAALVTDSPLSKLEVGGAMSASLFTCRPEDPIAEAEVTMGRHQVRRLPVVDEHGRLEGILSIDDIAREAFRQRDLLAPPVSGRETGRTLGEIVRPRLIRDPELSRA